jgi:HlyD family secretion protein
MTIVQDRVEGTRPTLPPLAATPQPLAPGRAGSPSAPPPRPPKKSRWPVILGTAVVLGALVLGTSFYLNGSATGDNSVLSATVQVDSFDVRIPLNGEMKASRNVEIRNQVEGQTTIVSIVPEGSHVKEGDTIVTLASDAIKEKLEDSRIRLDNAVAATVNSQELLHIQEMQNESDLKTAETNAEMARLEYEQFDKGDSKVQIETLTTALENAKTDLERKVKDLGRIKTLAERQFVSDNDVLDIMIQERDSRNKLATAELNLQVWKLYTEPRQRAAAQRKRDEAAREFERTKARANAQLLWRQADLRAKQSTQRVEETRYKAFQEQLEACTIKAPQAGMVVYQTSVGGNQNQGPIEEGATVRQNQVLIQLPDTARMLVEVRLAEQLTDKVKRGQEAVITVDAVPGKAFRGKVETIAVLPDSSQRWANPNLKEYLTTVALDEMDSAFKPGMSAKAEILVDRLKDVVTIPLQAVFSSSGESYVFVGDAASYEKRTVTLGMSSSTQVEVKAGLKVGEHVLLSRPKDAPADQENTPRPKKESKDDKPETAAPAGSGAPAAIPVPGVSPAAAAPAKGGA